MSDPSGVVDLGTKTGAASMDASRGNFFRLTLSGDVTVALANVKPGESVFLLVRQDVTGGHALVFTGQTVEGTFLMPSGSGQAVCIALVGSQANMGAVAIVASASSADVGNPSVADYAALVALDTTSFVPGTTSIYVESVQEPWIFARSSLTPVPGAILNATKGGQFLRSGNPSPIWANQTTFYVDPAHGNDENPGTLLLPLKTFAEFGRRTIPVYQTGLTPPGAYFAYQTTVFLMGDNTEDVYLEFPDLVSVTFDGTPGRTALASGVLSSVTTGVAATKTAWQIQATGIASWAPYVGVNAIGLVTSGPRVGTWFALDKDLGAGAAQIGVPGQSGTFSGDPGTLQVGDPFTIYKVPQAGAYFYAYGGFVLPFMLQMGDLSAQHQASFSHANIFADTVVTRDCDGDRTSQVSVFNLLALNGNVRAYESASVTAQGVLWHSGIEAIGVFNAINIDMVGPTRCRVYQNGVCNIVDGWLAIFDTSGAISIAEGGVFDSSGAFSSSDVGDVWGTGINGPAMISMAYNSSLYYGAGHAPSMTGPAAANIVAAATPVAFGSLPYVSSAASGDNIRVQVRTFFS